MNKCEHGERISHFCLTENCQNKEPGACELCLKKYHAHQSHTLQLTEEELCLLLKKFALDNSVKPKCRILQEAVYSYFNEVKTELVNALEAACKNIINQIGYPYLFATNALTTYKRLKNKEYRKINPKELRAFYEMASRTTEKDLAKEEGKIYHAEIKTVNETMALLDTHLRGIEAAIKSYSAGYAHDGMHLTKIAEIIKSIGTQSPIRIKRSVQASKDKDKDISENKITSKEVPKLTLINSPHGFLQGNPKLDYKCLEARASELKQRVEKVEAEMEPLVPAQSVQLPTKPGRDISLDKKLVKDHKFGYESKGQERPKDSSDPRLANAKIETLKMELNHKEMQINQRKKILMDIMKPSERQDRQPLDRFQSIELNAKFKPSQPSYTKREQLITNDTKSVNQSKSSKSSQDLSALEEQSKLGDTKNYAFTKLPIEEGPKKSQQKQPVLKKLMIVPTELNVKGISGSKSNEVDSPLYKKRKVQNCFDKVKEETEGRYDLLTGRKMDPSESKTSKDVVELKEYQEKSLALLLKSLSLSAEEAVTYLQASIRYAENNLSAAEYLSYLYLQLSRPKDCLTLCNKTLDRLESANEAESLSSNIINNKAAALNLMGRYSEAILILEQNMSHIEKDTSFKNLADSYYSIGMLDKAIGNYQKSLKLNSHNDECHYNLAACFYMQQNYENARVVLKRAMEIHPKNEAYIQLESHINAKLKGS